MSRTLRTNQSSATRRSLGAQTVQDDVEVAPPLAGWGGEQGLANERPDLPRLEVAAHGPGTLGAGNDLPAELLELGRARLLSAVRDTPVQSGLAHVELRD